MINSNFCGRTIKVAINEDNLSIVCSTPIQINDEGIFQDEKYSVVYSNVFLEDIDDLNVYFQDFINELKNYYFKRINVSHSDYYEVM